MPNEMLISHMVTHWPRADTRRRIEFHVGVEYGTTARRVIELLVDVAKANPNALPHPEPRAFFLNFGDSSLDFKLRVSIGSFDDGHATTSDLAVVVQEALDEAGIRVPFPQRDLHLVGVNPDAAGVVEPGTNSAPQDDTAADETEKE